MKSKIHDFDQARLIELGLGLEHTLLLKWFMNLESRTRKVDETIFYWVNYQSALIDLPILGIKRKETIYRKFQDLVKANVLKHHCFKDEEGTFSYYAPGENYALTRSFSNV